MIDSQVAPMTTAGPNALPPPLPEPILREGNLIGIGTNPDRMGIRVAIASTLRLLTLRIGRSTFPTDARRELSKFPDRDAGAPHPTVAYDNREWRTNGPTGKSL